MIGNTVDTDLIGEVVEIIFLTGTKKEQGRLTYDDAPWQRRVMARGRVRAVTPAEKHGMVLWLHIFDEACVAAVSDKWPRAAAVQVDDIVAIPTFDGTRNAFIRLVREGQKP